jgi:hypothetical protein
MPYDIFTACAALSGSKLTLREPLFPISNTTLSGDLDRAQLECDALTSAGDIEADLLAAVSVHPMRRDAIEHLLKKANADWSVVNRLIMERKLTEITHSGHTFYMRRLPSRQ